MIRPLPSANSQPKNNVLFEEPSQREAFLQEITPQPFSGSIIADRGVYGKPKSIPKKYLHKIPIHYHENNLAPIPSSSQTSRPIPSRPSSSISPANGDSSILKQKRLEEDMASTISILSKKLELPKDKEPKKKPIQKSKVEEKLPPASMNEILQMLGTIDTYIEATAIIKTDGTILASAISSRISDSLFATISQNLSLIGTDIIDSLSAGILKSISIRGTEGVFDLAPIDKNSPIVKDMILVIFSHPKVKSGVISIAANLVKKQIKEYLGIKAK